MTRDHAHDPRAIANKILDMREETGGSLTIMQLIKLVYIADGWALALLGRPLAWENPEAWQYGPVFRSVYRAFAGNGARPVTSRVMVPGTNLPVTANFTADEEALIRQVVDSYGKLSAYALSNLTHQPGTPWQKAYERALYADIDIDETKSHFESLKTSRLAAA